MAAQVSDVHGRRLRRDLPLPEPAAGLIRGEQPAGGGGRREGPRRVVLHGELPQGSEPPRAGVGVESSGGGGAGELRGQAAADECRVELPEALRVAGRRRPGLIKPVVFFLVGARKIVHGYMPLLDFF
jgi:hypothetical protein